jgi:Skp family chaperone for outer membrane proteins
MITRKFATLSLLLISFIALSGCNQEPPKPQAVVINMLEVNQAVYMADRLKAFSGPESKRINTEMKELGAKYMQEIEDKKASFGDNPTKEQEDELQRMTKRLQQQFNRERMTANTRLNEEKNALRQSIMDVITPIVQQVATEHGATIVVRNNSVFWSEDVLDITSEVIARLPAEETRDPAAPAEATEATEETDATEGTGAAEATEATDSE